VLRFRRNITEIHYRGSLFTYNVSSRSSLFSNSLGRLLSSSTFCLSDLLLSSTLKTFKIYHLLGTSFHPTPSTFISMTRYAPTAFVCSVTSKFSTTLCTSILRSSKCLNWSLHASTTLAPNAVRFSFFLPTTRSLSTRRPFLSRSLSEPSFLRPNAFKPFYFCVLRNVDEITCVQARGIPPNKRWRLTKKYSNRQQLRLHHNPFSPN